MRRLIAILAVLMVFLVSGCGMSKEEISAVLNECEIQYQSADYENASENIAKLEKSEKNMSDAQKTEFELMRSKIQYARENKPAIDQALNTAKSYYDQKMYYEAQAELSKLSAYDLPPVEGGNLKTLQTEISKEMITLKISESLNIIEAKYNSGDYNSALEAINTADMTNATPDQLQRYQTLRNKTDNAVLIIEAQKQYNNGNYSTSLSTLQRIDSTYLTTEQQEEKNNLNQRANSAIAAAEQKKKSQEESKYNSDGILKGASYHDGEYYYNGRPVGKGALKDYAHGNITKEELEQAVENYGKY